MEMDDTVELISVRVLLQLPATSSSSGKIKQDGMNDEPDAGCRDAFWVRVSASSGIWNSNSKILRMRIHARTQERAK